MADLQTLTLLPTEGGGFLSPTTTFFAATLNHLSCGSQTLWLLVSTFLPQFEKILAKSIDQGIAIVIFEMRGHEKLETWIFFVTNGWNK